MSSLKAETYFLICKVAGFGLLFALLITQEGGTAGFFLLLFLALMSLLRWRFPKLRATILVDILICNLLVTSWEYAYYAFVLITFEGMYRSFYWVALNGVFPIFFSDNFDLRFIVLLVVGALCGLFLGKWEREYEQKFTLRDQEAGKYYELEHLQSDIMETLPQIERMTAVAERARIARDIHDNAGHEIVAAYISLQTVRGMLDETDTDTLELYDAALKRLSSGVGKIRETAHNLQTVTSIGVETLLEICEHFPGCPVNFRTYGDTSRIPVYVWNMLEACLNESLTNVTRHAVASFVNVELDATQHIVRLCIENDGAARTGGTMGSGLRNLRHRAISIGGNFSVDAGEVFRVICVIPIQEEQNETITS